MTVYGKPERNCDDDSYFFKKTNKRGGGWGAGRRAGNQALKEDWPTLRLSKHGKLGKCTE